MADRPPGYHRTDGSSRGYHRPQPVRTACSRRRAAVPERDRGSTRGYDAPPIRSPPSSADRNRHQWRYALHRTDEPWSRSPRVDAAVQMPASGSIEPAASAARVSESEGVVEAWRIHRWITPGCRRAELRAASSVDTRIASLRNETGDHRCIQSHHSDLNRGPAHYE